MFGTLLIIYNFLLFSSVLTNIVNNFEGQLDYDLSSLNATIIYLSVWNCVLGQPRAGNTHFNYHVTVGPTEKRKTRLTISSCVVWTGL